MEHLFAALAARGLFEGVEVELSGPEVPILDGASKVFLEGIRRLEVPESRPCLRVERTGRVQIGVSVFEFAPADAAGGSRRLGGGTRSVVEVEVGFDDLRIDAAAAWDGSCQDFSERIADARTFAFASELESFLARGLARVVAPESVIVFTKDEVLAAGRPYRGDEPACHKVLDLIGDLYVYGGPPEGRIHAVRPGHRATHAATRQAIDEGILVVRR